MPKVKEGYFEDKKNAILDVAEKICQTKPLYKFTMKDLIKETGLSPGAVYASFSDIDDVIVALINRADIPYDFMKETDQIVSSQNTPEEIIEELFSYLIQRIQSTVTSYGKLYYEISTVLTDSARRDKITSGLNEVQMYSYILKNLIDIIEVNLTSGYFRPKHSKESIYAIIFAFFDGLVRDLTFLKCYQYEDVPQAVTFEETDLPKALAYSIISLLKAV